MCLFTSALRASVNKSHAYPPLCLKITHTNKLFTKVSFCSSSGSSSIVFCCLTVFVACPLQSESPEQTALIFDVFPRPSKSLNICQCCCFTNWAIADVGQNAFDVERMSTTTENAPSGLTFLQAGKSHFL